MRNMNFKCLGCGHKASKWSGQCHRCKQWNSYETTKPEVSRTKKITDDNDNQPISIAKALSNVSSEDCSVKIKTHISEFDQAIGGGITKGSLTLLSGKPGVGKTTLMTQVCLSVCESNHSVLYISGEESVKQVAQRFNRVQRSGQIKEKSKINLLHENDWNLIKNAIDEHKPDFIMIDSIQTTRIHTDIFKSSSKAMAGISQIKQVIFELMELVKTNNIPTFIIGHINKDGAVAGPKALEHMVDTSLYLRQVRKSNKRELVVEKNRFGSTFDIGLFEMSSSGLAQVSSKNDFYLTSSSRAVSGRAIAEIRLDGREILCESQCLCVHHKSNILGLRVGQGISRSRLVTLIAIIEKHLNLALNDFDIYIEISAPQYDHSLDLCCVSSILSSYYGKCLPLYLKFEPCELALSGEFSSSNKEVRYRNIGELELFIKELP